MTPPAGQHCGSSSVEPVLGPQQCHPPPFRSLRRSLPVPHHTATIHPPASERQQQKPPPQPQGLGPGQGQQQSSPAASGSSGPATPPARLSAGNADAAEGPLGAGGGDPQLPYLVHAEPPVSALGLGPKGAGAASAAAAAQGGGEGAAAAEEPCPGAGWRIHLLLPPSALLRGLQAAAAHVQQQGGGGGGDDRPVDHSALLIAVDTVCGYRRDGPGGDVGEPLEGGSSSASNRTHLVLDPGVVDVEAGRVSVRVPEQAVRDLEVGSPTCSPGGSPPLGCLLHLHLFATSVVTASPPRGGGEGGSATAAAASAGDAATGAAGGLPQVDVPRAEWLGSAAVLLLPEAVAEELQGLWIRMVQEAQLVERVTADSLVGRADGSRPAPAAAEAEAEVEVAEALAAPSGPRSDPLTAQTYVTHMRPLLDDIAVALGLPGGPRPAWGVGHLAALPPAPPPPGQPPPGSRTELLCFLLSYTSGLGLQACVEVLEAVLPGVTAREEATAAAAAGRGEAAAAAVAAAGVAAAAAVLCQAEGLPPPPPTGPEATAEGATEPGASAAFPLFPAVHQAPYDQVAMQDSGAPLPQLPASPVLSAPGRLVAAAVRQAAAGCCRHVLRRDGLRLLAGFPDPAMEAAYAELRAAQTAGSWAAMVVCAALGAVAVVVTKLRLDRYSVEQPLVKALAGMLWLASPMAAQCLRLGVLRRLGRWRRLGRLAAARDQRVGSGAAGGASSAGACSSPGGAPGSPSPLEPSTADGDLAWYDTLAAACTGLLASVLGFVTYTCSRPDLDVRQDEAGFVFGIFMARAVLAPLLTQMRPGAQVLASAGMAAVDLVHVHVLWGGAVAPAVLAAVLAAVVNLAVSAVLDVRERRAFAEAQVEAEAVRVGKKMRTASGQD